VARGKEARARDPHRRFAEWLATNSDDDPPRDLAVHAAVCVACQQRIAALDMLTAIDPALAGMPPVLPVPVAGWPRTVGRAAVVAGGVAALAVVGVGSWRLIEASNLVGPAVESPTQAVLGGTGAPAPTPPPSMPASAQPSSDEPSTAEQSPTARPSVVVPPPAIGQPTPPPVQPTVRPTARPRPTATPRPPTPAPTPLPTSVPTPPPTPPPTPEPTLTPSQ
jgi:hypothetical protein